MNLNHVEYDADAVSSVRVDCTIFRIRVIGSDGGNLELTWRDSATRHLVVKQGPEGLRVTDRAAVTVYGPLSLINLKQDAHVIIKIPNGYAGKLVLQSGGEKVHLTDVTMKGSIGVASTTGEILLEQVGARVIDVRGNHGKVNCFGIEATELIDISSQSGAIACHVSGLEEDYTRYFHSENRHAPVPDSGGNGARKLRATSRRGAITVEFSQGGLARAPHRTFDLRDAFRDW